MAILALWKVASNTLFTPSHSHLWLQQLPSPFFYSVETVGSFQETKYIKLSNLEALNNQKLKLSFQEKDAKHCYASCKPLVFWGEARTPGKHSGFSPLFPCSGNGHALSFSCIGTSSLQVPPTSLPGPVMSDRQVTVSPRGSSSMECPPYPHSQGQNFREETLHSQRLRPHFTSFPAPDTLGTNTRCSIDLGKSHNPHSRGTQYLAFFLHSSSK